MRSVLLILAFLYSATCLQSDEPVPDIKQLQGTWEVVEFTVNGKAIPAQERVGMKFEVADTTMKMFAKDREAVFKIKLDPSVKPHTIDYTAQDGPFKGKTNYGIYEIQGDDLKLCMHNDNAEKPPTEFKSVEGDKLALIILKRAKAKP